MLHTDVGHISHPDLVAAIRQSQLTKQVRNVAEVVLAICAQWLEALLLPAFDAQFLHQSQGPVAATIEGLILEMFVNRSVAIAASGLTMQFDDAILEGSVLHAAGTGQADRPVAITAATEPEALAELINAVTSLVLFYETIAHHLGLLK